MPQRSPKREPLAEGMRTRLSSSQKALIQAAALKTGQRPADFLREAALARASEVLSAGQNARAAFADLIGLVDVPARPAREAASPFEELLLAKHAPGTRRKLS